MQEVIMIDLCQNVFLNKRQCVPSDCNANTNILDSVVFYMPAILWVASPVIRIGYSYG